MNCKRLLEEMGDYLDLEASEGVRLEVEEHCRRCHKCWLLLDTCRQTVAVYCRQETGELPAAIHAKVMDAVVRYRRALGR